MSAMSRMPVVAGTLSIGALLAGLAGSSSLRSYLSRYLHVALPGYVWKTLVVVYAVVNIKSLPFVWHYRVFRGILYHLFLSPHPLTRRTLFTPLITTSYTSPLEVDYNLHKSNSTYFSDLDVARAHYVGALLATSNARLRAGDLEGLPEVVKSGEVKGRWVIALGAVACVFQREIAPMEGFEVWTRLLAWDRKWIYIISHVVRKGAVKPSRYHSQPWKKGKGRGRGGRESGKEGEDRADEEEERKEREKMKKAVFASSIAKYVCKKGRLTIPPEIALDRSRLLPPRPAGVSPPQVGVSTADTPDRTATPVPKLQLASPENLAAEVGVKLATQAASAAEGAKTQPETETEKGTEEEGEEELMTWEEVEQERLRGLAIAEKFEALSAMHDEFGRDDEVVGMYDDFLF